MLLSPFKNYNEWLPSSKPLFLPGQARAETWLAKWFQWCLCNPAGLCRLPPRLVGQSDAGLWLARGGLWLMAGLAWQTRLTGCHGGCWAISSTPTRACQVLPSSMPVSSSLEITVALGLFSESLSKSTEVHTQRDIILKIPSPLPP